MTIITKTINHAHMYCGLGGGAKGMNQGRARVGSLRAQFECIGGIDVDPACVRDFHRLSGAPGTLLDLMSREQYIDFHGRRPPDGWREATPHDIQRAYGFKHPHILFLSPPCKGFSGLLSSKKSESRKYQALNALTLRGIWLAMEAYRDDPIELILLENVPRIATRGRWLLDQISGLLRPYGYAVAETTHDCGELGHLAQSRKRFLYVARHMEKVPSFLYQPARHPLRAVGDVLSRMPLPGDAAAGPMHRIPALQWKTWVRLAFVEAGSDWRSLNKLAVENGILRDYGIMPEKAWQDGVLGVLPWSGPAGTVIGKAGVTNGRFAVADARQPGQSFGKYAITPYDAPAGTVISGSTTGQGAFAVADSGFKKIHHNNVYRVVPFNAHAGAVTAGHGPSSGGQGLADPRPEWMLRGREDSDGGALSVQDPRPGLDRGRGDHYLTAGQYGVRAWNDPSGAVSASACHDNGCFSVADPRGEFSRSTLGICGWGDHIGVVAGRSLPLHGKYSVADVRVNWSRQSCGHSREGHYGVLGWRDYARTVGANSSYDNGPLSVADHRLPEATKNCVAIIRSLDGTWHRPFTTLELAALQGLLEPEEQIELDGLSDSAWRERIGNAVPPPAAAAIASVMGEVLLLTWAGETFTMSSSPIWVRPVVAALMAAM